ncbi:MAG: hypothetical protein ACRELS_14310, partial [Candidatus Rokuibacteriota bacterium]
MFHGWRTLRLMAVVIVCVLSVTFTTPAKAEAIDPFTAVGLATAAVGVVILVVFLVVANMSDAKRAAVPVLYACAEAEGQLRTCWPLEHAGSAPVLV